TAANERERQAKNEAIKQKEKADANFLLAKSAVDRYDTHVSENRLLREPGMEPLRKQLLEDAREFYDKFTKERADDPELKGELARALFRLGQITGDIESEKKAIALHQQAVQIFAEQGAAYDGDQARCEHHLGRLYRQTDQPGKSEESYKKALEIWERVVPKNAQYEPELARTRVGLGNVHQFNRQLDQARQDYEKAMALWARLDRETPGREEYQRELANT